MGSKRLVMTVLETGRDAWGGAGFVFVTPKKTFCLLAPGRGHCALCSVLCEYSLREQSAKVVRACSLTQEREIYQICVP